MDHIQNNAHFTMKELPPSEKPYEKCLEYGPGMLSDAELLAVVLRTGSRGQSAVEMCRSVLASFREESLCGLYGMTADELMQFRGIGKVKAVQLECIAHSQIPGCKGGAGDLPESGTDRGLLYGGFPS